MGEMKDITLLLAERLMREAEEDMERSWDILTKVNYDMLSKKNQDDFKNQLGLCLMYKILKDPCVDKIIQAEQAKKGRMLKTYEYKALIEELFNVTYPENA